MTTEEPPIGAFEKYDINEHVRRLLRDLGSPEPPLKLEEVRALQKLDLTYYSKSDLNMLDEIAHRARLAGNTIMTSAKRMADVVEKFGLRGLLMLKENEKKIFIDDDKVFPLKRRFVIAHEITHDLLPWHRSLLLGDNEETLSLNCHQTMEAEANFGARQLIFMGEQFRREALDCAFDWKTIEAMKKRYGNTLTTTLWQMVCERDPTQPAFGMISRHPYHDSIGNRGNGSNVAYFIRSDAFRERFANVSEADGFAAMRRYATTRRRGPIGEAIETFTDVNGELSDFEMFTFSNGYDLLTYGVYKGRHRQVMGF